MKKTLAIGSSVVTFLTYAPYALADTINIQAPSALGDANNANASVLIRFVINGLIIVGIVASLLFLLWGGIRWIMSGGDKGKVDSARGTIVAAIVGLIIVILAWVIINTVLQVLTGCTLGQFQLPNLSATGNESACQK